MRRIAAVLALGIVFLVLGVVPAVAGGPNNLVSAQSTAEGTDAAKSVVRTNVLASPTGTDELGSRNVAEAFSHDCTGCRAVAVAFQAVLATGTPHTVRPENMAVAVNLRCSGCASFAFAFQYVVTTGGPAHLRPEGEQAVEQIRQKIDAAANSDLPFDQLNARLEDLMARFQKAIDDNIMHTGSGPPEATAHEQVDRAPAA